MTDKTDTLEGFLHVYGQPPERIALDIDVDKWQDERPSAFIILRSKGRVFIVNPMTFSDHLCIDVHSFIDGEDARAGVFGMDREAKGSRITFPDDQVAGTSHGWPATSLVTLLLGEQRLLKGEE